MEIIPAKQSIGAFSPQHFGLVLTDDGEKLNIMAVSWFTFASTNPPKITLALSKKGYTGETITKTGKATLVLPVKSAAKAAYACGTSSGRTNDKISQTGLTPLEIEGFSVPAIEESSMAWSLELIDIFDAGDHNIFLMEIKCAAKIKEEACLYAMGGYSKLDSID